MLSHGVLGKVSTMHSRMEARRGKANSERAVDIDAASPCERVIELFVDIDGREWDGAHWMGRLKPGSKPLGFKEVQDSLFGAPYSAYISDIERHLHRVGYMRGIKVAFACETELVYQAESDRYEVVVARREAAEPATDAVSALLPQDSRVSLGVPELVVVAEGGGRNILKSQGILERHRVEIKIKSPPKYFASALTKHPKPSQLITTSSILGETHYCATPDQEPHSFSVVSGNVISRAPRYLAMEQTDNKDPETGMTIPPDTWFVRVPNDDLALERLPGNVNPQDFGIIDYKPTPGMTNYVSSRVLRMIGHFSTPEIASKAEIIKIARPFPQTDTVLEKCGFANVAAFGDAARTGSFLSGMGMNSLIGCNCWYFEDGIRALRQSPELTPSPLPLPSDQDLVVLTKTVLSDPSSYPTAMETYTKGIQRTTSDWHAMTKVIQSEVLPPWVPDLEVKALAAADMDPTKRKADMEPPKTVLRFRSIEGMGRYAIANLVLNYGVPLKPLRVGLRRLGEWVIGGVKRTDLEASTAQVAQAARL